MATFTNLQTRYLYLIGDTSSSAADTAGKSHINYAIKDILNSFPFSWSLKKTTGSLSGATFNLASDINWNWGLFDARIVNSGQGDDNIFTRIPFENRDAYDSTSYVYWLTQDTAGTITFNTISGTTGTVTYTYFQLPTDLSAGGDITIIPDGEAIAYLAASKNWIGDERNQQLSIDYERKGRERVTQMWKNDNLFGPELTQGSAVDLNASLVGGSTGEFRIYRPY